ncbi:DMT family transporter [Cytophagaceae bacterium ABcell3]|nr:DMT family transporter [Cytophagaceae bacterium ABcell3]
MSDFAGLLLVFVGAVLFSTKAILVKLSYHYEVPPVSALALRMLFSLPFYICIAYFIRSEKTNTAPVRKHWLSLVFLGLAGYYFSSLMDFEGLNYITASLERLILFIYPTLVIFISAIVFRTKIKKNEMIALLMTYGGIFFVILTDLSLDQKDIWKGSFLVFLSALSYAIYLIGSGKLIPVFGPWKFTSYVMIVSCLGVFVHFFIQHDLNDLVFPARVYLYTFLMAVISTVIPSFMLAQGIKIIGSGKASLIGSIGPVSTIFMAYIFLGEVINVFQVIGAAFVITGIILLNGYGFIQDFIKK